MPKMKDRILKIGKCLSFMEMIKEAEVRHQAQIKFVQETGLCCVCKTEKVLEKNLRCQTCKDKEEEILKQLRGPGFF
jgi:hypothetical protein